MYKGFERIFATSFSSIVATETMSNSVDMDDDDIYPENDDYVPQESKMQDIEDEEEGEELESDSDVRELQRYLECESHMFRTTSTSSSTPKMSPRQNLARVCISSLVGSLLANAIAVRRAFVQNRG